MAFTCISMFSVCLETNVVLAKLKENLRETDITFVLIGFILIQNETKLHW